MASLWRVAHEFMRKRRGGYHEVFNSAGGQRVLADLADFCRANTTCWSPDPRIHAMLEGRREVWLRIEQHLNLTTDQLMILYKAIAPKETDDV